MKVVVTYAAIVGLALKRARQAEGLTQSGAAAAWGITQSMLSRFESGTISPTLQRLARTGVLHVFMLRVEALADHAAKRGVEVLYDREPADDEVVADVAALFLGGHTDGTLP